MGFFSVLLLTILLAIGLIFFLRAGSKDRTTVVDVKSSYPPLEVLNGVSRWLEERGWKSNGGDAERQVLHFQGNVASSMTLALLLSFYGALGSASLGLVIRQLYPVLGWWPLLLVIVGGPAAGFVYARRAERIEFLEIRLMSAEDHATTLLRIRAHRDELIAMELELGKSLNLTSDGSLLSSPI